MKNIFLLFISLSILLFINFPIHCWTSQESISSFLIEKNKIRRNAKIQYFAMSPDGQTFKVKCRDKLKAIQFVIKKDETQGLSIVSQTSIFENGNSFISIKTTTKEQQSIKKISIQKKDKRNKNNHVLLDNQINQFYQNHKNQNDKPTVNHIPSDYVDQTLRNSIKDSKIDENSKIKYILYPQTLDKVLTEKQIKQQRGQQQQERGQKKKEEQIEKIQ